MTVKVYIRWNGMIDQGRERQNISKTRERHEERP